MLPELPNRVEGRVFPLERLGNSRLCENGTGKSETRRRSWQTVDFFLVAPKKGKIVGNLKSRVVVGDSFGQNTRRRKIENNKGGTAVNAHATEAIKGLNI